jgi:IS5 family transposase
MRPAKLIQSSFSDLEYASKGYLTRRDRLLRDLDALTPWPALLATIEPVYPKGEGPGRPPIGLEKMLRMYIVRAVPGPVRRGDRRCARR